MPTVTLKLPQEEFQRLESEAEHLGTTKSAILRQALQARLQESGTPAIADQMRDLIGSTDGPDDLSCNDQHLDGYAD